MLRSGRTLVHIDPGPGAFVNFFKSPYEPWRDLNAVVLSHLHLDHSADVNSIIESATESGKRKGLKLLAPQDALEGANAVVLPYSKKMTEVYILSEGKTFSVGDISLKVLHRHSHHRVEVYSLMFESEGKSVVYIPCGRFEERWLEHLPEGADLYIFNMTFYKRRPAIEHLCKEDVVRIVNEKKPKRAVITHFSLEVLRNNPQRIALEIERETGTPTTAAEDFLTFEV